MKNQTNQILVIALCGLLQFASPQSVEAQGKLSRIRESVRPNEPQESHPEEPEHDGHSDHHDNHHFDHHDDHGHNDHHDSIGLNFLFGTLGEMFRNRRAVVVHDNYSTVCPDLLPARPPVIHPDMAGTIVESSPVYESVVTPIYLNQFNAWNARVTGFGGTDFDDITQGGLGILLQQPGGFGLDTSITVFRESGVGFRDHMWLGDVNFVKEFASERMRARMGLGMNWLSDSIGGEAGFNLTAGLDYEITSRLLFAAEVDLGTLGSTDLFHTQLSVARRLEIAELVVGYDHYDIGGTTLGGAFIGLRFRF